MEGIGCDKLCAGFPNVCSTRSKPTLEISSWPCCRPDTIPRSENHERSMTPPVRAGVGDYYSTTFFSLATHSSLAPVLHRAGFPRSKSLGQNPRADKIGRRLAVIVPVHQGDSARAMDAISKWPSTCHRETVENIDLIIYEAEARRA